MLRENRLYLNEPARQTFAMLGAAMMALAILPALSGHWLVPVFCLMTMGGLVLVLEHHGRAKPDGEVLDNCPWHDPPPARHPAARLVSGRAWPCWPDRWRSSRPRHPIRCRHGRAHSGDSPMTMRLAATLMLATLTGAASPAFAHDGHHAAAHQAIAVTNAWARETAPRRSMAAGS
jgi:hypothetical protein